MRRMLAPMLAAACTLWTPATPRNALAADATIGLQGSWTGEGKLMGKPAVFSMHWQTCLGGKFLQLRFRNAQVVDGVERPGLEAQAFYRLAEGSQLVGTWFDSRGQTLALSAAVSDSALVTRWTGSSERGRTVYRVLDDSMVQVDDFVETPTGERPFASARYRKAAGDGGR